MQNENVRMKEREIALVDLLVAILLRWRVVILAMLIGGMLLGVFSYYRSSQTAEAQRAQLVQQEQLMAEQNEESLEKALSEKQILNVNSAIMYEQFRDEKMAYQKESILMQIDPFNAPCAELTFLIQSSDMEKTYSIQKIYEDLLTSTEMFGYLQNECGIQKSVNELVSLEDTSYGQVEGCDIVRIQVLHKDESTCKLMADSIIQYVEQQQKRLQSIVGIHEIDIVEQTCGTGVDTDLLTLQKNCDLEIASYNSMAIGYRETFTNDEWYYYNYLMDSNLDEKEREDTKTVINIQTPGVSIKYVIVGMILFAFGYVFVIFLLYIFNNKLCTTDNFQDIYNIPQLGSIVDEANRKKKVFGFVDRWILKLRYRNMRGFTTEEAFNLAAVATKMAVKKQDMNKVCLMGCNLAGDTLKFCEQIKERLMAEGTSVQILNNVLYDAEAMEKLADMQGAVLVETVGSTLYGEIIKELELLNRHNIIALGGIIVE